MENTNDKLTYYILREKCDEPGDVFNIFIDDLKGFMVGNSVIQERPGVISVSANSAQKGIIENNPPEIAQKFSQFQFRAKLILEKEDSVNLHVIKMLAARARVKYRIFSVIYDCFLPISTDLINLEFGVRDEKLAQIFSQFELKPLYLSQKLRNYYALTKTGEVVLVNNHLINYLYGKDIPEKSLPELYYLVANSMQLFGLKYDRGLVPTDFYEYYNKPTKIINSSNLNITNPGKKVFVKPYVFELREDMGEFYQLAGDDGQAMLVMDKIRSGETLDATLKRVLKEELKIANDYIGAYVSSEIEFDRDRDGIITPRLVVWVYIKRVEEGRPKAMQMSQTGWKSMGGDTPRVNVNQDFKNSFS